MAKPKLVARKTAEKLLYNLYANLYFSQKNALMTPNKTDAQQKYLTTLTSFLEIASASDFTNIVASLDNEGFLVYYDKVSELVKFFAPCLLESVRATRPIEFNMLDDAISQITDANLAADIIEGFSAPEIARLPFTSKMKTINTLMDTWFKGQNREREMVKVLNAITADERPTFLSAMVAGENAMLKKICDKTDGAENASVFVLFDNLLSQMGYTVRDKNGITIPKERTISACFDKSGVALTSYFDTGRKDKEFAIAAFTPVTFTYQKEKITVPAFTFTDKDAFKDFVFENKYLETLDWSKLTEKQKDDYYFEFVMHYLPGSFLEQLGSPIQIIIGAIIGIIVGGALAEFEAVLAVANGAMIAGETVVAIKGIYTAYKQRTSAKSIHELKESARTLADGVAKFSMQIINAILMFKARSKGIKTNEEFSIGYANKDQVRAIAEVKNPKKDLIVQEHPHNQMRKGNFGEMKVDIDLESSGNIKRISKTRVTSLDEATHHGIDGIYKNLNPPPDYIIVDAKYMGANTAISDTIAPKMSTSKQTGMVELDSNWIRKNLNNAIDDEDMVRAIKKLMELNPKAMLRIAAKVDNTGKVTYYYIDDTGKIVFQNGKPLIWIPTK